MNIEWAKVWTDFHYLVFVFGWFSLRSYHVISPNRLLSSIRFFRPLEYVCSINSLFSDISKRCCLSRNRKTFLFLLCGFLQQNERKHVESGGMRCTEKKIQWRKFRNKKFKFFATSKSNIDSATDNVGWRNNNNNKLIHSACWVTPIGR